MKVDSIRRWNQSQSWNLLLRSVHYRGEPDSIERERALNEWKAGLLTPPATTTAFPTSNQDFEYIENNNRPTRAPYTHGKD